MKYLLATILTLAFLISANICYANSETDIQDFIRFLEGDNTRVRMPKKDKAFFIEAGAGMGFFNSHRNDHNNHDYRWNEIADNHKYLSSSDFNGKIGYNAGKEKWFFTLEYAQTRAKCQHDIFLNVGTWSRPDYIYLERRKHTQSYHTGGIGVMYYPIPEIQISTTFPVGYNFSVAYDHKIDNNNSLLFGIKSQLGIDGLHHHIVVFCKYRFVARKPGGSR
jgi:hypothetical protein